MAQTSCQSLHGLMPCLGLAVHSFLPTHSCTTKHHPRGRRWSGIRNTCSYHHTQFTIFTKYPISNSALLTRAFHETWVLTRRHLWSKTFSLNFPSTFIDYISQPQSRTRQTIVQYTRHLVGRQRFCLFIIYLNT